MALSRNRFAVCDCGLWAPAPEFDERTQVVVCNSCNRMMYPQLAHPSEAGYREAHKTTARAEPAADWGY